MLRVRRAALSPNHAIAQLLMAIERRVGLPELPALAPDLGLHD
jgi:hypothetical protein